MKKVAIISSESTLPLPHPHIQFPDEVAESDTVMLPKGTQLGQGGGGPLKWGSDPRAGDVNHYTPLPPRGWGGRNHLWLARGQRWFLEKRFFDPGLKGLTGLWTGRTMGTLPVREQVEGQSTGLNDAEPGRQWEYAKAATGRWGGWGLRKRQAKESRVSSVGTTYIKQSKCFIIESGRMDINNG